MRSDPGARPSLTQSPPAGAVAGQISVWLCRPGVLECEYVRPDGINEVLGRPDTLLWVDIRDPGPEELAMLGEEFHFHRLALEDAAKQRQRPKVDEYPGYFFVVMYAPLPEQGGKELQTAEIDMFVGKNYVVTLHRGSIPALDEAIARWQRTDPELRSHV